MSPVWKTAMHTTPYFGGRTQKVSAGQQQGPGSKDTRLSQSTTEGPSTASVRHSEGQHRCGVDTKGWNTVPRSSAAGLQRVSAPAEWLVDAEPQAGPRLHLSDAPLGKGRAQHPQAAKEEEPAQLSHSASQSSFLGQLGGLSSQYI